MCVIIHKPAGERLKKSVLEKAHVLNPHGWGFVAWTPTEGMQVYKAVSDFESFWLTYEPHQNEETLTHFRWKTHGKIDKERCHPYRVLGDTWMMHNGVIRNIHIPRPEMSDTEAFVESFCPMLEKKPTILANPEFVIALGERVGANNKLVFASPTGVTFVNKSSGHMDGNVWYSNDTLQRVPEKKEFSWAGKHLLKNNTTFKVTKPVRRGKRKHEPALFDNPFEDAPAFGSEKLVADEYFAETPNGLMPAFDDAVGEKFDQAYDDYVNLDADFYDMATIEPDKTAFVLYVMMFPPMDDENGSKYCYWDIQGQTYVNFPDQRQEVLDAVAP